MAKKKTKGGQRPPPIDKLIKPAIGIGLALLAYQFLNGINSEVCVLCKDRGIFSLVEGLAEKEERVVLVQEFCSKCLFVFIFIIIGYSN